MSNQISFLHLCENNALSHESIGKTQYTHRHTHVHTHTQTQTTFCEWVKEAIEGFSQVKEHFLINDDEPWMKKPLLAPLFCLNLQSPVFILHLFCHPFLDGKE